MLLKCNWYDWITVKLLDDYMVPYEQWTHIDYLFGINAGKYVYSKVIEILSTVDQQHENNIDIGTSHNNTINLIAWSINGTIVTEIIINIKTIITIK